MKKFAIIAAALFIVCGCNQPKYSWEEDLQYRLGVDFTLSREQVKEAIQEYIPEVTDEQIDSWTASGKLEAMEINGEQRWYRRTPGNLFRVDPECKAAKDAQTVSTSEKVDVCGNRLSKTDAIQYGNLKSIITGARESGNPIQAGNPIHVKYTLKVKADAVPAGETVKCWLPYPRTDVPRQQDVKFIGASEEKYIFSDPECQHSTLYMEKTAVAGEPTVFTEEFEYTPYGEWYDLPAMRDQILPYDTSSELYKHYTAEREKHIVFSDRLRKLAAELTEGLENPYDKAWAIFTWINDNFPWAGAREYSTLENIPEYVLDNGHGDCGQVTLLLVTLCRIEGIPARFQSGFLMRPWGDGMHDWGEIYFEGIGWVPADMSFGIPEYICRQIPLQTAPGTVIPGPYAPNMMEFNAEMERFYLGGIDSYRWVVNNDYGCELSPKKSYPRSETVDFQRGEVEWKGGNLYYPEWSWNIDLEFI